MSFHRLAVLVSRLPVESETARSLGAPRPGEWTATDHLLALVADQLAIGNHFFLLAHVKKGTSVPKPKMVPRPGDVTTETKRRPATAEELAAALGRTKGLVRYHPKGEG